VPPAPVRKSICKLRTSAHRLFIEIGRYTNIPRSERICTSVCPTVQMDDKTCPVCKLRCSRKDVMLRHSCPTIFLSRSQYELSRMFSVFLSCMDNATSYQTACCGVIDNVAILHWLNIISYAYHHDMFVN
jgi:hypothetical protein